MNKKLLIFGNSAFSEIAAEYFARDTEFSVVGHVVDKAYLNGSELNGRPIFDIESKEGQSMVTSCTHFYAAATYTQQNDLRAKLFARLNSQLSPASYISPYSYVDPKAEIGEHCFIFENNVLQLGVRLGENSVLWSGNHIGHHSTIGKNSFISSHVVISGHVTLGDNSFLGVNSTIYNNVTIGSYCWLGPGSIVNKNLPDETMMRGDPSKPSPVSAKAFFKRG